MLKKILYIIVSVLLGFVVFYISWRDSYSKAVMHRGQKALDEHNYEFFCKFMDYYEKDPIFDEEYLIDGNTTRIIAYNVFSKEVTDAENNKVSRSGIQLLIFNVNMEKVKIDTEQPPSDESELTDETKANYSKMVITSNTTSTYESIISTYGYDQSPIVLFTVSASDLKTKFTEGDIKEVPTTLTHITLSDTNGTVFFDNTVDVPLVEHNDEAYWTSLYESGVAGRSFTPKEVRSNFTFAFPEMRKTIIITMVTILILIALGVFIFWPKKSYVPTEEVDRETYTFASTEEKEKYAIAKVARGKKEKEERENRYKNVRKENNLEDLSNEAIINSLDKENTAEAALAQDQMLEANEAIASEDVETKETVVEATIEPVEENETKEEE